MESMTGYAFAEKSTDQFSFSVEIKSLNSRYIETFVNLPRLLRNEEQEFLSLIKEKVSRGKIEVSVEIFDWQDAKPLSLNKELIAKYYQELEAVHKTLKIKEPLRFESVLGLEGVTNRERSGLSAKSKKDLLATVEQLIKKMIEMRKKEGAAIKKDLLLSLKVIETSSKVIEKLSKGLVQAKQENLRKRLQSLAEGNVDDQRFYSEIAILSDKLDINEELVRLRDHLKKYKAIMKEKGQIGKKLDFVAQEMFREINTIASKSNSSEISHLVVEMKNHIDKIREHCRNVV